MTKIAQHHLKEAIKKELGKEDKLVDYLEDINGGKTGPEVDSRARTNETFRLREDIPKHLRMFEKKGPAHSSEILELKEKYSGTHMQFLDQEKFAWNLIENEKIDMLNSVALPTATEMLFKKSIKVAQERKAEYLKSIEELYGKQSTNVKVSNSEEAENEIYPDYFPVDAEEGEAEEEETKSEPKATEDK